VSVTIDDVREAARRIAPVAKRTPVLTSRLFSERTGVAARFKCENFQTGGSFKIRGAANLIFSLSEEERTRGVVAFSSGNHAQATAIAARHAGAAATIVLPDDAPRSKVEATRAYGAQIVTYDRLREDREAIGRRLAEETGAVLAPPFDHPKIIAGQGTVALELLEECPDLDALVVCVGGGGLIAGCATAAKALNPAIRVFGVEPERANDTWQSFRVGRIVQIPPPDTIADGLRPTAPGKLTFPIIQRLVEDILLVSEEEIRETVKYVMTRMKTVVEPSGAVAAAAILWGKLPKGIHRPGIVVSGGNVDWDVLAGL
jgi:threonine dehydratase